MNQLGSDHGAAPKAFVTRPEVCYTGLDGHRHVATYTMNVTPRANSPCACLSDSPQPF